jgi:hypothetical protein
MSRRYYVSDRYLHVSHFDYALQYLKIRDRPIEIIWRVLLFNRAVLRVNYIPNSVIVAHKTTLNRVEHCFVLGMRRRQCAHFKNVSKRTSPVQIV